MGTGNEIGRSLEEEPRVVAAAPEPPDNDGRRRGLLSRAITLNELGTQSRGIFLRDVERQLEKKQLYNLDEQFAGTRRNRSPLVALVLLAFAAVLAVLVVLVASAIQNRSQQVPVTINAFNDVNLRDILDKAKQLELQMEALKRNLADLDSSQAGDEQSLQNAAAGQEQIINNTPLPPDERQRRLVLLHQQTAQQMSALHAQYGPRIAKVQDDIAATQKSLDAYDERQVQLAKQQEAVLNNQQKLFDLQMQKTTSYYEQRLKTTSEGFTEQIGALKKRDDELVALLRRNQQDEIARLIATYNPTFSAGDLLAILGQQMPAVEVPADTSSGLLIQEGRLSDTDLATLKGRFDDIGLLLGRLQQVPYKNSVPAALLHLKSLEEQAGARYQQIANSLADLVRDRDRLLAARVKRIEQYDYAVGSLATRNHENGYVIDARDPSSVLVFVDPLYKPTDGQTAYVFRRDDEEIATLDLHPAAEGTYASVVNLTDPTRGIQPFDKVLLELPKDQGGKGK